MYPRYMGIPPFAMFTRFTPALPQFYTDVPTMEQGFKELCKNFHKMVCYVDNMANVQNLTSEEVEQLKADFQKFMESGFDDYYAQQVEAWVNANVALVFEKYASQIYFGLTDDGHFCTYIPESWSDITFDTGMVYGRSDYGRLILRFTADGSIDNSYSYSLSQSTELEQLIADLEVDANRTDETYNAVFTNVSEVISNGNF